MLLMSVTAEVFQEPMGWLKALAKLNMLLMLVTAEVSHGLVEGTGGAEHAAHASHRRSVPGTDGLVEGTGDAEHAAHASHRRSVPGTDGLVEVLCFLKL